MFKKQHLALAIAATLAAGAAQAALETSVTLKNETARFIKDGIRTGEATSKTDTTGAGKSTFKFENTAKIFLNDELENGASWHGELNIVRDTKAINDYKGHESYTQKDWLRELYMDTTANDWDIRLGKQQVVWGTADGIKLLDMINPTDWSEFNQNTPADARIPVWMINAEKYLDNGANVQIILSQAKSNVIAGLGKKSAKVASGATHSESVSDQNHPFVMKGVDTITGQVNGFLNIAPELGYVAAQAFGGGFTTGVGNLGGTLASAGGYEGKNQTVYDYVTDNSTIFNGTVAGSYSATSWATLCGAATSVGMTKTNLCDTSGGDGDNPNNAFEYMTAATFATFDTLGSVTTEYRNEKPKDFDSNLAFRFKNTTSNGTNYSINYAYAYDANPAVNLHLEDSSGNRLYVATSTEAQSEYDAATNPTGTVASANEDVTNVHLFTDASKAVAYANYDAAIAAGSYAGAANLVFTEKHYRTHNLGGSFDTTIETADMPIVLRGEALYMKDVKTPVIDRKKLGYGDLVGALKMEDADYFKYVIGADVNVLTDMMVSGQFIQFRNLDFVDESQSCSTQHQANCGKYTADMAAMHLSNGLQKAEKNKEFYSLFLSKPFGDSGEGRWNNIFMYEEGGGKWNRFDVEYGFDDQLIGTFEVNKYFGDENTMFGQFENASNVQIGLKYLLQ
jgi:hypothetical protein